MIRRDFTFHANLTMQIKRCGVHHLHHTKLKVLKFSGNITWHCVMIANQFLDSQQCFRNLASGPWIRHGGWNNFRCVWISRSSYNTTLYTTGLCYEHRHDVMKLYNFSGTSTTDTLQKWWLYQSKLMTENGKPLFLVTLQANANCGWHRAVWHNLTGFGQFYEDRHNVVTLSNLSMT